MYESRLSTNNSSETDFRPSHFATRLDANIGSAATVANSRLRGIALHSAPNTESFYQNRFFHVAIGFFRDLAYAKNIVVKLKYTNDPNVIELTLPKRKSIAASRILHDAKDQINEELNIERRFGVVRIEDTKSPNKKRIIFRPSKELTLSVARHTGRQTIAEMYRRHGAITNEKLFNLYMLDKFIKELIEKNPNIVFCNTADPTKIKIEFLTTKAHQDFNELQDQWLEKYNVDERLGCIAKAKDPKTHPGRKFSETVSFETHGLSTEGEFAQRIKSDPGIQRFLAA